VSSGDTTTEADADVIYDEGSKDGNRDGLGQVEIRFRERQTEVARNK
jgi:hypothetical protein